MRTLTMLAAAAAMLSLPALARDASEAEKAALNDALVAYDAAYDGGDAAALVDAMPPSIIEGMAIMRNIARQDVPAFRAAIVEQLGALRAATEVRSHDIDADRVTFHETPAGRLYALVPTRMVERSRTGDLVERLETKLAFVEDGEWRLMNAGRDDLAVILKTLHKDFADIDVPRMTVQVVPE